MSHDLQQFIDRSQRLANAVMIPMAAVLGVTEMMTVKLFLSSEDGFILSTEALLIGTIAVIGLIVGLAEVRNAVVQELGDFSQAVAYLSQDYAFTSVTSTNVATQIQTGGSTYADSPDTQHASATANGVSVTTTAATE